LKVRHSYKTYFHQTKLFIIQIHWEWLA